ncbi:protein draper-like isoform X2 [Ostrea edulis]|uniref:protein draper-like isoform X2 n=1 Tax=Ostrea edulis TaxID=37623 RepID=UPI002095F454|nr:protein draper-like isoform X2 [Ostrea edulis]
MDLAISTCCLNYINIDGDCIACLPGTMGINCSRLCPDGFYGQFCLKECNCHPTQRCSKANGCVCKGNNCSSVSHAFDVVEEPSCTSSDAVAIALGFVIVILLFVLMPVTVQLYRLRKLRTKIKSPTAYMETDIQQENAPLHSYEAMMKNLPREVKHDEQPTDVSTSGNENYLEPKQATIKPVVLTGQYQQTKQTTTCNTSQSKVKVSDLPSQTSHITSFESPKTVDLVAMETPAEDNGESYLDMGQKQRLDYLDVIATVEQAQELDPDTSDYVEAESQNVRP